MSVWLILLMELDATHAQQRDTPRGKISAYSSVVRDHNSVVFGTAPSQQPSGEFRGSHRTRGKQIYTPRAVSLVRSPAASAIDPCADEQFPNRIAGPGVCRSVVAGNHHWRCVYMKHNERPVLADNSAKNNWETLREASLRLSISPRHLRKLMQAGTVPWYRVGDRRIVLDPVEVDQAIRNNFRQDMERRAA